jgi:guanosine-3',5'-bis(diphosphate) 3'-pyrophosphohydrolase
VIMLVDKAREIAVIAHKDQMYGNKSYIYHLDMVHKIVRGDYNEYVEVLAYLHDVKEDTNFPTQVIVKLFGDYVNTCVDLISDCDGKNRKEKKLKTNKKLSEIGNDYSIVLIVKVADRLANLIECCLTENKSLFDMYQREHVEFKKAVYRKGLCDELWLDLDKMISTDLSKFK